jgi:hypothetical protein
MNQALNKYEILSVPIVGFRLLDQDSAHGFGGGGEEVPAAVEVLPAEKAEVSFVDQGRGLQRLAGPFLRHPLGRQLPEIVVDQRQKRLCRGRIALPEPLQDLRHVSHAGNGTAPLTTQRL